MALGSSRRVTGPFAAPAPLPCQQQTTGNKAWAQQEDARQPRGFQTCQQDMYERALELSRQEKYDQARVAFEQLVQQHPTFCKAWVSYAQMERRMGRISDPLRLAVARQILQRGLATNPDSGCLAQAWGLMELQKGNFWAAVRLLERSVVMDPFLTPVLRWKPVSAARKTIAGSSRYRPVRARGVACASQGTATAAAAGASVGPAASASSSSTAAAGAGGSSGGVGGGLSGGTFTGGSMSSM